VRLDGIEDQAPLGESDRVRGLASVPVADGLPVHREHEAGTRPLGVCFAASVHLAEQSAALPLAGFPLKLQLA
jgi:hypothetical protein